jgi:hypothetical protein
MSSAWIRNQKPGGGGDAGDGTGTDPGTPTEAGVHAALPGVGDAPRSAPRTMSVRGRGRLATDPELAASGPHSRDSEPTVARSPAVVSSGSPGGVSIEAVGNPRDTPGSSDDPVEMSAPGNRAITEVQECVGASGAVRTGADTARGCHVPDSETIPSEAM